MKKLVRYGILSMVMVLLLALAGCGEGEKPPINLNDYIKITFDGYDTIGTAEYSIDYDKLVDDNLSTFKLKSAEDEEKADIIKRLGKCVKTELDKTENLSNGDEVTLSIKLKEERFAEDFKGVTLEISDIVEKVTGLKGYDEVDVFAGFDIEFSGMNGEGYCTISNKEDADYNIVIGTSDNLRYLHNGDVLTLRAEYAYGDIEAYLASQFKKPITLTKQVTVTGLAEIVSSLAQLNQNADAILKDITVANIKEVFTGNDEKVLKTTPLGRYFAYSDDWKENDLFYVYEVEAQNGECDFTYYYYNRFSYLAVDENGELQQNLMSTGRSDAPRKLELKRNYYYGYLHYADLVDEITYFDNEYYKIENELAPITSFGEKVAFKNNDYTEIDIFENMEVLFHGMNGDGYIDMELAPEFQDIGYDCSLQAYPEWGFANGDTITVYLTTDYYSPDSVAEVMAEYGYKPKTTEIKITVSGLSEPFSDVTPEDAEAYDEKDIYIEYYILDYDWYGYTENVDMNLIGCYYMKDPMNNNSRVNELYLLYEVQHETTFAEATYYTYVAYSNVRAEGDGEYREYKYDGYMVPEGGYYAGEGGMGGGPDDHEDFSTILRGDAFELINPNNSSEVVLVKGFKTYPEMVKRILENEADSFKNYSVHIYGEEPTSTEEQISYK